MRSHSLSIFGAVWAVIMAWAAPSSQAQIPEGWEIVEIFPAGTEYHCGPPDINDKGQVVFERRRWPSFTDREIFLYDDGELLQLTHDDVWDAFPRINNLREIVWQRDIDPDPDIERYGIVRWREGGIETIAEPPEHFSLDAPDINDSGWIVWDASSRGLTPFTSGIWLFDGESVREITPAGTNNQGARINAHGHIVWTRYGVPRGYNTIMLYDCGTFRPLRVGGSFDSPAGPHLNEIGQVVWTLYQNGLELWSNEQSTRLVSNNAIAATVSNCGEIAFSRWDVDARNDGLWLIREDQVLQLTNGAAGGFAGQTNDYCEIAFNSGAPPSRGLSVFRRTLLQVDLDSDDDGDLIDFAIFQSCFGFAGSEDFCKCRFGDVLRDGRISLEDWGESYTALSGPR